MLSAFNLGLGLDDLRKLTYVDVMKMFVCYVDSHKQDKEEYEREATQEDIDSFF